MWERKTGPHGQNRNMPPKPTKAVPRGLVINHNVIAGQVPYLQRQKEKGNDQRGVVMNANF